MIGGLRESRESREDNVQEQVYSKRDNKRIKGLAVRVKKKLSRGSMVANVCGIHRAVGSISSTSKKKEKKKKLE